VHAEEVLLSFNVLLWKIFYKRLWQEDFFISTRDPTTKTATNVSHPYQGKAHCYFSVPSNSFSRK